LGHGGSADSLLYTGKIYEYATSGRPVLAVVDEGPAADLLRAAGQNAVLPSNAADEVAALLRGWVTAWRRGERPREIPPSALRVTWERRYLAARAAEMLSRMAP
jgi:hypothetical protein